MCIRLSPIRFRMSLIIMFLLKEDMELERKWVGRSLEELEGGGGGWIFSKCTCIGIKTSKNKYVILKTCVLKEVGLCTLNRCVLLGFVDMFYWIDKTLAGLPWQTPLLKLDRKQDSRNRQMALLMCEIVLGSDTTFVTFSTCDIPSGLCLCFHGCTLGVHVEPCAECWHDWIPPSTVHLVIRKSHEGCWV